MANGNLTDFDPSGAGGFGLGHIRSAQGSILSFSQDDMSDHLQARVANGAPLPIPVSYTDNGDGTATGISELSAFHFLGIQPSLLSEEGPHTLPETSEKKAEGKERAIDAERAVYHLGPYALVSIAMPLSAARRAIQARNDETPVRSIVFLDGSRVAMILPMREAGRLLFEADSNLGGDPGEVPAVEVSCRVCDYVNTIEWYNPSRPPRCQNPNSDHALKI